MKWDELISKFLSIRAQEREVEAGLQEESVIKGQLNDVVRKLKVFEQAGHTSILKNYQHRKNQSKAIDSWEILWKDTADHVRAISKGLLPLDMDDQHFSVNVSEEKDLLDAIADVRIFFERIQVEINSIAEQIDDIKRSWKQKRICLAISQKIGDANQEYANLLTQLSTAEAGDPSTYGVLVEQRQNLEEKLKDFIKKRELLTQHQKNAKECLAKIYGHRAKITKLREDFLREILAENPYVQINVIPFGNRVTLEEEFRHLIDRGNGGFDRDIGDIDGDEGLLSTLSQNTSQTMEHKIEALKSTLFAIHNNDSKAVEDAKDQRFVSYIQGLTPERFDRIRCWFPDDSLEVCYSLKDGESFKPIEQGSPGQKTAALLAFILSYGNEPLILDQPEDDLDNHLVYDLIVKQLREIKQKRQVLIVTHNANIVVNGDAENVIVLDIRSGQTHIISQGGLQDSSIRGEICKVMEGGKEAFDQRYKRLNTIWD